MLRDTVTHKRSALQVVGARNLHKRVCRLACGDCALRNRVCRLACGDYGDYVETVHTPQKGETGARTPVPPRTKRRDDLHIQITLAPIPGAVLFGESRVRVGVKSGYC